MERLHRFERMLKNLLVDLNLFKAHLSDQRQVHYQRISTRLYILLLLCILIIIILYSTFIKEIHQKTIKNPSQSQFSYLQSLYSTSLDCPCSTITNTYEVFLNITPQYHQVCSSDFFTTAWFNYLNGYEVNAPYYYYLDYRTSAANEFQFLSILYQQAQQTIVNSLQLFLQEEYVTTQVVSEELFNSQANASIQDWQSALPNDFQRTLQLIQSNHEGNQLMAALYSEKFVLDVSGDIISQSEVYVSDDGQSICYCVLNTSCREQISIYNFNTTTYTTTKIYGVPGAYTGCYPVDALFASTLECYYEQSCMGTIALYLPPYINSTNFTLLNASRNQPNEPIGPILSRMFVDSWLSNISFSSYYQACSPASCTYQYTRQRSILSYVTIIISVFGGLTTSLKIIISILLRIALKIRTNQSFYDHCRTIKNWFLTFNIK
jgi:hypothetical protein